MIKTMTLLNRKIIEIVIIFITTIVFFACGLFICNAETVTSGECGSNGDNVTWTLDSDGTLTISGSGTMYQYKTERDVPWYSKRENVTKVVINSGVTSTGEYAFFECSSLSSVTIPNSVTSIGAWTFSYCSSLNNITIPNSVTYIGDGAFRSCSSMSSVSIPNSVTAIGSTAFRDCSSLSSITIPNGVKKICDFTFCGCNSLSSITIPNSVKFICDYAFDGCSSLSGITIPNSVKSIGVYAFASCSSLRSITILDGVTYIGTCAFCKCSLLSNIAIPNSVTYIGDGAFTACSSLSNIAIPNSVTYIGEHAFQKCSSLNNITIPNSVTSLGDGAFSSCSSLSSVTISNRLKIINASVFRNCSSLSTITIPDGVTSIQYEAFYNCSMLNNITIPNSVTAIRLRTFNGCSNLTDVYYSGSKEQWGQISIDYSSNHSSNKELADATIHFGSGGGSDDGSIDPCPATWQWGKDNYSFVNSFGKGSTYYLRDEDFAAFLNNLSNTEIARCADHFGSGDKLTPHKVKLYNFLTNHLRKWGGSCYGMSLTAAMFKEDIKNSLTLFGYNNTHDLSISSDKVESFINYYHMSYVLNSSLYSLELSTYDSIAFPAFMNNLYSKAKKVNAGEQELLLLYLGADDDGDMAPDSAHAVICYGAIDGDFSYGGKTYSKALLIADPNKTEETYIYISSDSTQAVYTGKTKYNIFGVYHASLAELNNNDYNRASHETHDEMYYQLLSTGKKIVILGEGGKKGRIILDGSNIILDESSADWFIDVVREMGDDDSDEAKTTYRLSGDVENYTILPYEDSELDAAFYSEDFSVNISGEIQSAEIKDNGEVRINDGTGAVNVDYTANDSVFTFAQVSGLANGDVDINLEGDNLSVSGDISDYTISNTDRNANEITKSVPGNTDTTVTVGDNNTIEEVENSVCAHEWNTSYTVDTPATCTLAGSESIHCSKCGATKEDSSRVISPKGHNLTAHAAIAATNKETGNKAYWSCNTCGKYFSDPAGKVEIAANSWIVPKLNPSTSTSTPSVVTPTAPSEIVDLPAVKISKPKAAKKGMAVKWKKVSKKNQKKIQGIEIQVAADPGFTQIVNSATVGKKKTTKKIKGMQNKTIYYVRIRAYRNAADGKHVSAWKVKTVKTK